MKKKVLSAILALCMALPLCMPAMAVHDASMDTAQATAGSSSLNLGSGTQTTLTGTIAVTQVSVTVPASASFILDPTIDPSSGGSADPDAQVKQPKLEIENASLVPVYVKISNVDVANVTGSKPQLVQVDTNLKTTDNTMMFSFKQKDEVTDFSTQTDWLTEGAWTDDTTAPYLINSNRGRIEPATSTASTKIEMQICAQTYAGWSADDSFTITPTLVVAAKPFV